MTIGLVGRKVGMTRIFTDDGDTLPVTVLDVSNNRVAQIKTAEGKRFRARLQNLSPTQAKALCEDLKRQKQACQPIQPASVPKATMADASQPRARTTH